ncbi:MAG: pyrroline-5-carboxylate reductase [Lachnospiraceae bacterium]|nr:pyrroline-5-carboxylate reductase [Lachnospiraceae bacterium]
MKITFIGLGNMATAMINGILLNGIVDKGSITGTDISLAARINSQEKFGIKAAAYNALACEKADIIILAIKPQIAESVLEEIKGFVSAETIILSIMAGKTMAWIADRLTESVNYTGGKTKAAKAKSTKAKPAKIVRAMPNTPALVGEAMTGVCRNAYVSDDEMDKCLSLLNSIGKAEEIPETLIDAVIGVSGSAPAYVFIFIEALADAGVAAGMPREQAYRFAARNVLGSAKMVLETGKHPGELKDMVCSPGGTTIEAVKVLEEKGFRDAVIAAAAAAIKRAGEL